MIYLYLISLNRRLVFFRQRRLNHMPKIIIRALATERLFFPSLIPVELPVLHAQNRHFDQRLPRFRLWVDSI